MRAVNFRDYVLHPIASKLGLDPTQNFEESQAEAIGRNINQWVRDLFTIEQFPEWSKTQAFQPNASHIVPYTQIAGGPGSTVIPAEIMVPISVHLIDPLSTNASSDIPFELVPEGIYVGTDHGTLVWIRFMSPAPKFTAVPWDSSTIFNKGEPTYVPSKGECYISKINGNRNHNPSPTDYNFSAPPPATELTQRAVLEQPGIPVAPYIVDAYHIVDEEDWENGDSFAEVHDANGNVLASVLYSHQVGDTNDTIITALRNQLASDPGLASFTITFDLGSKTIRFSDLSNYSLYGRIGYTKVTGITVLDKLVQVQAYSPGLSATPPIPQRTEITFTEDQIVKGATYRLRVLDQAGVEHAVEYVAQDSDAAANVIVGLAAARDAAVPTDPYMESVSTELDTSNAKLSVLTLPSAVDVEIRLPGDPYWELNPFPLVLASAVIQGVVADVRKEWGEPDVGMAEESKVPEKLAGQTMVASTQQLSDLMPRSGSKPRYSQ